MDNHNIDVDETDAEALQAQIDLSMSFAQNLVSSWIKPFRKLPNRDRDVEAELKEYMRRPPRLGVGAPIPETQIFSRETARLKGQLMGRRTKHSREDEDVTKDQLESSDDQESRARAITKKTRLDPFGDGNGKKKRKKQMAPKDGTSSTSMPPSVPGPTNTEISEQAEVIAMITEPSTTDAPNTVVSSAQPLTKNPSAKSSVDEIQVSPAKPTPTPSGSVDKTSRSTPKEPLANYFWPWPPKALQVVDTSPTAAPAMPSSRRSLLSQSAEILGQPVLNLNPPSSDDDDSDKEVEAEVPTALSPKKKRRRRRKKKHSQLVDVTMSKSNGAVQTIS